MKIESDSDLAIWLGKTISAWPNVQKTIYASNDIEIKYFQNTDKVLAKDKDGNQFSCCIDEWRKNKTTRKIDRRKKDCKGKNIIDAFYDDQFYMRNVLAGDPLRELYVYVTDIISDVSEYDLLSERHKKIFNLRSGEVLFWAAKRLRTY